MINVKPLKNRGNTSRETFEREVSKNTTAENKDVADIHAFLSPSVPRSSQMLCLARIMSRFSHEEIDFTATSPCSPGSLALIKCVCVFVWRVSESEREECWHDQMECHSSSTRRKVIARPVTRSFSSNLFVSSPCTCLCHPGLEIKMNEATALFFILSALAVIKTGAARIVVACRWCDWYGVKARGKVSQCQINGWLSKMKEMEDENQALLWQGTLAEQHRAAICLCSDLSGKMWSMFVINSRPLFSIFVLLHPPPPLVCFLLNHKFWGGGALYVDNSGIWPQEGWLKDTCLKET